MDDEQTLKKETKYGDYTKELLPIRDDSLSIPIKNKWKDVSNWEEKPKQGEKK